MFPNSTRSLARWLVALPLLMVGSLMFWGMAISLGGLSLMRAMALASPPQEDGQGGQYELSVEVPDVTDGNSPNGTIMVHLQESAEPQDLTEVSGPAQGQDSTGAGGFVGPDDHAVVVPGPGSTSY